MTEHGTDCGIGPESKPEAEAEAEAGADALAAVDAALRSGLGALRRSPHHHRTADRRGTSARVAAAEAEAAERGAGGGGLGGDVRGGRGDRRVVAVTVRLKVGTASVSSFLLASDLDPGWKGPIGSPHPRTSSHWTRTGARAQAHTAPKSR